MFREQGLFGQGLRMSSNLRSGRAHHGPSDRVDSGSLGFRKGDCECDCDCEGGEGSKPSRSCLAAPASLVGRGALSGFRQRRCVRRALHTPQHSTKLKLPSSKCRPLRVHVHLPSQEGMVWKSPVKSPFLLGDLVRERLP